MMIFYPGSEGATVVSFHIISVVYLWFGGLEEDADEH